MSGKNYNFKLVKDVFNTPWFSVEEIPSLFPREEPYYSISCPDSVAILAKTLEGKYILVRQFRPPQGQYTLELPSGYVDQEESNQGAVRREFLEETGYRCEDIIYLGAFKICPSRISNTVHVYCGFNAIPETNKHNDDNDIEIVLVSEKSFEKYISNGTYNETVGIVAYFMSKGKYAS